MTTKELRQLAAEMAEDQNFSNNDQNYYKYGVEAGFQKALELVQQYIQGNGLTNDQVKEQAAQLFLSITIS